MKLFYKLMILVLVAIVMSFTIFTLSVIEMEEKALETSLMSKINNNETLYTSSVTKILFDLDMEVMDSLLSAIYQDKEIVRVNLIDYSDIMSITLDDKQINNQALIKTSLKLYANNIPLGELEIDYTKDHMQKRLVNYEKSIFTFSIIFTIVLMSALFYFISKATSSLKKLSLATDKIAEGDLTHEIHIDVNDEIGLLANKFEKMRESIQERRSLNSKQSKEIKKLNKEMFSTQKTIIETLGEIVETRYVDDSKHVRRVAQMSYILAKLLGQREQDAALLKMVSPMHDIGKIGISDAILLKQGELTPEEYEHMKQHAVIGYNILKDTNKKALDVAATVAYEHHEAWDGTGYPRGLKGEDISIPGRITALIDVYDALSNKRCYKDAWSQNDIKKYILDNIGAQFDPVMAKIFLENFAMFREIQEIMNVDKD